MITCCANAFLEHTTVEVTSFTISVGWHQCETELWLESQQFCDAGRYIIWEPLTLCLIVTAHCNCREILIGMHSHANLLRKPHGKEKRVYTGIGSNKIINWMWCRSGTQGEKIWQSCRDTGWIHKTPKHDYTPKLLDVLWSSPRRCCPIFSSGIRRQHPSPCLPPMRRSFWLKQWLAEMHRCLGGLLVCSSHAFNEPGG